MQGQPRGRCELLSIQIASSGIVQHRFADINFTPVCSRDTIFHPNARKQCPCLSVVRLLGDSVSQTPRHPQAIGIGDCREFIECMCHTHIAGNRLGRKLPPFKEAYKGVFPHKFMDQYVYGTAITLFGNLR
ncbi:hypothetical protein FQZ97_986470 [compost metagenome]